MNENFSSIASFLWSAADLLRGDFKQSQYGRVILPFTLLRRLECVLEPTKATVVAEHARVKELPEPAQEKLLLRVAKQSFYNTSPMNLSKLGETQILDNLEFYVQSFSHDAREIFEHFNFVDTLGKLNGANLLYKLVEHFRERNLSPDKVSNHTMGLVFEELIRRFAESSNETAGEHFTPRDIVRLTTNLVFATDDEALTQSGVVRSLYDPTAGTGGFLSSGMEAVHEMNPDACIVTFGQELNPESYAICKSDMLIKGQDVSKIHQGNTLSEDKVPFEKFDYMLSNPPFGVDWKKIEGVIKDENKFKGYDGRFGPGLPRVSDGSLLFLMHLISKMRSSADGGSRIGIILNGSPLFTGGAGSGESEIRRYILENDLLDTIIALPTSMFYNTGIATYVWILSNHKETERKRKVQLIDATEVYVKMRKSLGDKRQMLSDEQIDGLVRAYGQYEAGEACKIFDTTDFGYRRITVERPLRLAVQFSDENIAKLRYLPAIADEMEWAYKEFGEEIYNGPEACREEIELYLKKNEIKLKPKQEKALFSQETWRAQQALLEDATRLQAQFGADRVYTDFNEFESELKKAMKSLDIKLDALSQKQLIAAITWKDPEAAPVVNKRLKAGKVGRLYGEFPAGGRADSSVDLFETSGDLVTYAPDPDLRDSESIPLKEDIEEYFKREVLPHVSDAWIDAKKTDANDGQIGVVGYEIPFNRHFYKYVPPRALEEIDKDLDAVTAEIMELLHEARS